MGLSPGFSSYKRSLLLAKYIINSAGLQDRMKRHFVWSALELTDHRQKLSTCLGLEGLAESKFVQIR